MNTVESMGTILSICSIMLFKICLVFKNRLFLTPKLSYHVTCDLTTKLSLRKIFLVKRYRKKIVKTSDSKKTSFYNIVVQNSTFMLQYGLSNMVFTGMNLKIICRNHYILVFSKLKQIKANAKKKNASKSIYYNGVIVL